MIRFMYIILVLLLVFSCKTQQKAIKNTAEVNEAIIDSVNAQHDKTATNDSLNIIKKGEFVFVKKPNNTAITPTKEDSIQLKKYNEHMESKKLSVFNHDIWNNLLKKHVTEDGIVNYKGFKKDHKELKKYITSLNDDIDFYKDWSKEKKLAFWINTYNALTVDLILRNYPLKSIKDIKKPWKQRLWMIGYLRENLNDIEHKILREMGEPRIHFAINCASFSCPPLLNEAFAADKLDVQLTQVTKAFLADARRNTITKNQLEISKIFKWFSKDFKQNGSLIKFLNLYSPIKINADADIDYKDYDWSLNE